MVKSEMGQTMWDGPKWKNGTNYLDGGSNNIEKILLFGRMFSWSFISYEGKKGGTVLSLSTNCV